MSLINQVLRDLERREAKAQPSQLPAADEVQAQAREINAAQQIYGTDPDEPSSPRRLTWLIGLGLTAVALAAGASWWASNMNLPPKVPALGATLPPDAAGQIALKALSYEPDPKAEVPALESDKPEPPPALPAGRERTAAAKPVIQAVAQQPAKPASLAAPPQAASETGSKPSPAPSADQLYLKAQAELKQGQADAAFNTLRTALDTEPGHVQARLSLAQLLVQRKQLPAAADLLADGVMLLPQQNTLVLALAPLWIQTGQQEDALALLANSTRQPSATPELHGYYASQLLRLKRHAEAANQFRAALRSDPAQVDWLIGLGLSLQGAGQHQEAVDALRRAYETGKLNPERRDLVEQLITGLKARL